MTCRGRGLTVTLNSIKATQLLQHADSLTDGCPH